MNTLWVKNCDLTKLNLPGNWRKILDDPQVPVMAESIKEFGILHEPIVRFKDMKPVCGLHRIAACLTLGKTSCLAKFVECTDEEMEVMRLIENGHRNHNEKSSVEMIEELTRRIAEMDAKKKADLLSGEEEARKPKEKLDIWRAGRPKTPKGKARDIIAAKEGISANAIRMREYRERKDKFADVTSRDRSVLTLGFTLDDATRKKVDEASARIMEASKNISRALAVLTALDNAGLPVHAGRINHIRDDLGHMSTALRGSKPYSLCPYCKGLEVVTAKCTACMTTGFIMESQKDGVPEELWDEKEPKVIFQGQMMLYSQFEEEQPDAEPPLPPPDWSGVDPDGEIAVVEEEEDPWGPR